MKILQCEQRSEEWFQCRLGVPSASSFDKIVTTDGKPSKQRQKYLYKLAGEIVSGHSEETYKNGDMIRGIELEGEARLFYELTQDCVVDQIGFCVTDGYGCSPDGFIGNDGLLEIKCPSMAVHVEYLLDGSVPTEYFQQTQGQLLVTGRKWLDFMSYYPGIKPLIVRVEPDEKFQKALKAELERFCVDLNEVVNKIK